MAAAQPARFGAHGDDIADWMAQRWRDIANLGPEAGDAGRRLWAEATRSGQNLSAANPSDVYALGAQYLSGRTAALGAPQQVDPSQSYAPDPSGNSAGGDDWSNPLGQGGLFQLAAAPGKGFWDYWAFPAAATATAIRRTPYRLTAGPSPSILTIVSAKARRAVHPGRNGAIGPNAMNNSRPIVKSARKPGLRFAGRTATSG